MAPSPPSERTLTDALDRYDRLIEVGVGRRPGVALALTDGGREVVAVDVEVSDAARDAASGTPGAGEGSLRVVAADVTALATADDRAVGRALGLDATGVEAVYARNLPAELQSPTVTLAERLDAACLFTTLGFEEPTVDVRRDSTESRPVVYVAR